MNFRTVDDKNSSVGVYKVPRESLDWNVVSVIQIVYDSLFNSNFCMDVFYDLFLILIHNFHQDYILYFSSQPSLSIFIFSNLFSFVFINYIEIFIISIKVRNMKVQSSKKKSVGDCKLTSVALKIC